MNVLLTGGSGFIGQNIKEAFKNKYNLFVPGHKELDLLNQDQVDQFFAKNSIDVVIHAAAKPGHRNAKDPTDICYRNSRMFFNLIRNAERFGKMLFLGSGAICDKRYYTPKMLENDYLRSIPADEYGFYKYICVKQIENMDNIVELRLFGVFGKHEDYAIRFISNAICKVLNNLSITIKQNRKLDYLYVDDLMFILEYFISNSPKYCSYNITPNESIELYDIARKILRISGSDLPILVGEEGLALEYSGYNGRLHEEIPELHFTPIDVAIEHLYDWYKKGNQIVNKEYLLFDK